MIFSLVVLAIMKYVKNSGKIVWLFNLALIINPKKVTDSLVGINILAQPTPSRFTE